MLRTRDSFAVAGLLNRRLARIWRFMPAAVFVFVIGIVGPWSRGQQAAAAERAPNIIFIMADDLGYGELGCYGQKIIRTPNIDRLADDGIRFTQHYCGSPVCAPSRCVLMTGKHTGHSYIRDNGDPKNLEHLKKKYGWEFPGQNPIPDEEITIAELLHKRGYATAAIGKWGLGQFGTTGDPNRQGFDLFYGFNCQRHAHNHYPRFLWRNGVKEILPGNDRTLTGATFSQDKFAETALEFVRKNKARPFFLYLPFTIPHLGIQAPEESIAEYTATIPEAEYKHRGYVKPKFPRAGYAAMITHMDRDIGRILALVGELGLDDDTIVFFTSDNGPTYGRLGGSDSKFFHSSGPLRGRKGSVWEGGIRVPFIARWRGRIAPGGISSHPSAFWDILPTLAELAGGTPPNGIDGISMVPTLFGEPEQPLHDYLYWEFPAYGGQQAVRSGNWKAVRRNLLRDKGNRSIELFNLAADIGEEHNVAAAEPAVVRKMAAIMRSARTPSALFPFPALDKTNAPGAE